ncbi:hypothetical protein Acr_00g0003060 [Actinidia rufa]|uniref:Uncharacterized protein n=1 Tax=Actinidia rufa TaxID=165716 RepID=A0A7J0D709_9ERIC|nr:hypothetical protein Acr_00g0003060 [Actinidia rufa]
MARTVRVEWQSMKWSRTVLKKQGDIRLAIQFVKKYLYRRPKLWKEGQLYLALLIMATRWTPGTLLAYLARPKTLKKTKGLKDVLGYWARDFIGQRAERIINANGVGSVEFRISLALFMGAIAYWQLAAHGILELDPTAILQPMKIKLIKETISDACEAQNAEFVFMCTDDAAIHTQIVNQFQQHEGYAVEQASTQARLKVLCLFPSHQYLFTNLLTSWGRAEPVQTKYPTAAFLSYPVEPSFRFP